MISSDILYLISLYSDVEYRCISKKCNEKYLESTSSRWVRLISMESNIPLFPYLRKIIVEIDPYIQRWCDNYSEMIASNRNIEAIKFIEANVVSEYHHISWYLSIPSFYEEYLNTLQYCSKLTTLYIDENVCINLECEHMIYISRLTNLEELTLKGLQLEDDEIESIVNLKKLEKLNIKNSRYITDICLKYVASLEDLTYLNISRSGFNENFTDEGIYHICELSNLSTLKIGSSELITISSINMMIKMDKLNYLEFLPMTVNKEMLDAIFSIRSLEKYLIKCTWNEYIGYMIMLNNHREDNDLGEIEIILKDEHGVFIF